MPSWLKVVLGAIGAILGTGFAIYIVTTNSCNVYNTPPAVSGPGTGPEGPWITSTEFGKDKDGRKAEFLIAVLTQEYRWKLRETEFLESGPVGEVLPGYLEKLPKLEKAKEVIAVGTASQEGGLLDEESRADRRADEIIKFVRPISGLKKLYKLNLGQHAPSSGSNDTSGQRRVIIIGVNDRDPEMTLEGLREALIDALSDEKKYPFQIVRYSNFILTEV